MHVSKQLTRRVVLKLGLVSSSGYFLPAPLSILSAGVTDTRPEVTLWDKREYNLTLSFALPELPGEVFSIIVPEIVSKKQELILPYSEVPLAYWSLSKNLAHYGLEIAGKLALDGTVQFADQRILCALKITNLSERRWENVSTLTCLAYHEAPHFDDPNFDRTYVAVAGKPTSVAELLKKYPSGDGGAFFPVSGSPPLDAFAVCMAKDYEHDRYPQTLSNGSACVVSIDGKWVAGISAEPAAYVYINSEDSPKFHWRSIHADPWIRVIEPGQAVLAETAIQVFRGTTQEFFEMSQRK
jgi:hypothetical protein